MDKNTAKMGALKVKRAAKALKDNNFEVIVVERRDEVIPALQKLIKPEDTVSVGGSMTLFETGVIDWLRTCGCTLYDRYAPGLTPEQIGEVFRKAFTCDVYLTSTNALTLDGELVNVDGNGNRVAAMIFGPKSVVVVAGANKIVPDLEAAMLRINECAAPANNIRLNTGNPCTVSGSCMDCASKGRICRYTTVIGPQNSSGRIKVILVEEELGY
ncbi:MAG: lactate utilization protein [Clostridiales bacterium]|nr:lactate utilization protein [Clostridiales bacterium]